MAKPKFEQRKVKEDFPLRRVRFDSRKLKTQKKWIRMANRMRSGQDIKDVAEHFSCSEKTVKQACSELGVRCVSPDGSPGRAAGWLKASTYSIIKELIRGNLTHGEISDRYKISAPRVSFIFRMCKEHGIIKSLDAVRMNFDTLPELEVIARMIAGDSTLEISDEFESEKRRITDIRDRATAAGIFRAVNQKVNKHLKGG